MPERARCSVFIATSLDGFIAREDGSLGWLDAANEAIPVGEDCGYSSFISTVDTLVMGRGSFDKVLTFGDWPYSVPVVVLSRSLLKLPSTVPSSVAVSTESPVDLVERLSIEGRRHLYIDGGLTIQSFLRDGLIDDLTITAIPVLLGGGIPLFGAVETTVRLIHVTTRVYDFGFVQSTYRVT
jgi:dihydrofolate reductase